MAGKIPLYYTFGNHMHWVDMEWLWGYHVLPGSVRDMLRLCREAGAKGCVNFDGIGYEKLASEDPEAFADLREAIRSGTIEVVGGSYGQPYGQFHGGESNVRQRIFGARTVRRLFGVTLRSFWEEEFDFLPQLPQILRGVGVEYASLFFQWTWHTPEVPREEVPVVWWEAPDGSRLLTTTRNDLNLHQWPEDMELTFNSLAADPSSARGRLVQQWLELMPSPDWMCRSEVILPKLKELLADERFEVQPVTLSEYLERSKVVPPLVSSPVSGEIDTLRRYGMDQVWHGLTLGKNGDNMRRLSQQAEASLLAAEALAAVAGLFGRPYAQWDVYPTWELEEAWRELLSAQHHDNDECEGLCGHVGRFSYERSLSLSTHVAQRCLERLAKGDRNTQVQAEREVPDCALTFNPLGWERTLLLPSGTLTVPAFGFSAVSNVESAPLVHAERHPFTFKLRRDGSEATLGLGTEEDAGTDRVQVFEAPVPAGRHFYIEGEIARPDPGLDAAFSAEITLDFRSRLIADQPFSISEIKPVAKALRKYPKSDWMTSEQWFEEVRGAFTSLTFVDLIEADNPDRGLLICHDGSQQWFLDEETNTVRVVLNAYDPWDEDYFISAVRANFLLMPHGPMKNSEKWKIAQEFIRPVHRAFLSAETADETASGTPALQPFCPVSCDAQNVALTAFYRETRDCAKGQEVHAADLLGVDYPYVLRLVELDGEETGVTLTFRATVAGAVKTNLLGEPEEHLVPKKVDGEDQRPISQVIVRVRPFEIATIYLDLVEGRKQVRDLDAKREVWATVHRVDD